jgi:hypothetical protein
LLFRETQAGRAGTNEGIASSAGAKAVESQMTGSLTERYDDRIAGVLSCCDRVVVTGTLPTVCYAAIGAAWVTANAVVYDAIRRVDREMRWR